MYHEKLYLCSNCWFKNYLDSSCKKVYWVRIVNTPTVFPFYVLAQYYYYYYY
ncbi:hypothetical protein BJX76DRAFT_344197 [Aspergillus varians]